jgi:TetR/AcrR family transcriptional regulator, cholesterol catabolism regulator
VGDGHSGRAAVKLREPATVAARRAEASRQQILDTAARLLRVRGYTDMTLRDVAASVGMKAGSLYYHFASKEELAGEVMRIGIVVVEDAVAAAIGALPPGATPVDKLRAAVGAHLSALHVSSDYTSAHIRSFPYAPEAVREAAASARRSYEDRWRRLIAEADAVGLLRAGVDRAALRRFILGAMNWTLEWYRPERHRVADLAAELCGTLFAGALSTPLA